MNNSKITKQALASALKELMMQMPFQKISISDICDKCSMNRKSFYYHFIDKYDLVNWIFRSEFSEVIELQEYRQPKDFTTVICNYFYENRSFYRHALKIEGQNSFQEYFRSMLKPVVNHFFENVLYTPKYKDFITQFYTDAFIGSLVRWLSSKDCAEPDEFIMMISESFHISEFVHRP